MGRSRAAAILLGAELVTGVLHQPLLKDQRELDPSWHKTLWLLLRGLHSE